jgi:hypothetical protein
MSSFAETTESFDHHNLARKEPSTVVVARREAVVGVWKSQDRYCQANAFVWEIPSLDNSCFEVEKEVVGARKERKIVGCVWRNVNAVENVKGK